MVFKEESNYILDALLYCERRANSLTLSNVRSEMNKTGDEDRMAHAMELSPLIELENAIGNECSISSEQLDFFFTYFADSRSTVLGDSRAMFLFKPFITHDGSIDDIINKMLTLSDLEFAKRVMYSIVGPGEITFASNPETLEQCFEQINLSTRNDEVKWYICQTMMLRKKYLEQLRSILNSVAEAIINHRKLYEELIDSFKAEYEGNISLVEKMLTKLGGNTKVLESSRLVLLPMLFVPVGYYVFDNYNEQLAVGETVIYIGILAKSYFTRNTPVLETSILPQLSVICDKTRFKLLQRIASEPAYGQQLAEEFGMTTPNVYHHMGKLVQAKFAAIRIDRNRNYYTINKNYINQLLEDLRRVFRC